MHIYNGSSHHHSEFMATVEWTDEQIGNYGNNNTSSILAM